MLQEILYILFFMVIGQFVLVNLFYFCLALKNEVIKINRLKNRPKTKNQSRLDRKRTTLDIIVYSQDNPEELDKTLRSITKQAYKNIFVIVADNNSTSSNLLKVNNLVANFSKQIKLLAKTKRSNREAALKAAYKKHSRNEWVLTLDAGAVLERDTLHAANSFFLHNPHKLSIIPNLRISHDETVLGLIQQTNEILKQLTYKAGKFNGRSSAVFYRSTNFAKLKKASFLEGAIIETPPSAMKFFITNLHNASNLQIVSIFKVLRPLVILFSAYVAFSYDQHGYLLLAYFCFAVVLMMNIAVDNSRSGLNKIKSFILNLPVYVLYIFQETVLSLLTLLANLKRVSYFGFQKLRS